MSYAETSWHKHYVTIQDAFSGSAGRTCLALGPFDTRQEAEVHVENVRRHVASFRFRDVYSTAFLAFGTSRLTLRPHAEAPAGKFNTVLLAA